MPRPGRRARQWLWLAGLYLLSVAALGLLGWLLRALLPHGS